MVMWHGVKEDEESVDVLTSDFYSVYIW
jgi:hypothetical protein